MLLIKLLKIFSFSSKTASDIPQILLLDLFLRLPSLPSLLFGHFGQAEQPVLISLAIVQQESWPY